MTDGHFVYLLHSRPFKVLLWDPRRLALSEVFTAFTVAHMRPAGDYRSATGGSGQRRLIPGRFGFAAFAASYEAGVSIGGSYFGILI